MLNADISGNHVDSVRAPECFGQPVRTDLPATGFAEKKRSREGKKAEQKLQMVAINNSSKR